MLAVESAPRSALQASVDQLAAEPVHHWSNDALAESLVELRHEIDRLEAECSRRLRLFDERHGYRDDGAPSMVAWLRHRCGLSSGAAAQRVEIARQLPTLPEAQARFAAGDIGLGHAAVLARVVSDVGPEAALLAEPTLLEAAQRLDPSKLRLVARHLRQLVDPDGALLSAIQEHERRYLHLSQTFDGVWMLDGLLDAEGGAVLNTALGSLSAPLPEDTRSAAQRRADALVEVATRQLQGGELPASHGQRPHLVLTAPLAVLAGAAAAGAAELETAGAVLVATARRLACDAVLSTVLEDDGSTAATGRERRTIAPALRRALDARDRGCRFPGCDRPPAWTDAHHIQHWADGGATTLSNLVLLCRVHHRFVHEHNWSLTLDASGGVVAQPP